MTREEFNKILDEILPPTVGGMVRPSEPIPTDLDFCTEFRQFLQADMDLANHENAFLRQLFSNDKQCQIWIDELIDALDKQDFNLATQKIKGLMSAADKAKVDGVQAGAEVNQNAISNLKVGAKTVAAATKTDTIELAAGNNIALSASGKKITVAVKDIASGAEVNQNAFSVVQVGTTKINAAAKTDTFTIAAGKNVSILTDAADKKITIQLDGEMGLHLLKRNTAYAVGDIAYSQILPSWACLECVTAGETANTNIELPQNVNGGAAKLGFTFTDGTVSWLFRHKDDTKIIGEVYTYAGVMSEDGLHPVHKTLGIPMMNHWICNGANGACDLRDRFIVGAGGKYKTGNIGGAETVALTAVQMPVHAHTGTAWTDAQGNHAHKAAVGITYSNNGNYGAETQYQNDLDLIVANLDTTWNGNHSHNVGVSITNTGGGQAHENRPPYYALTYIMKL